MVAHLSFCSAKRFLQYKSYGSTLSFCSAKRFLQYKSYDRKLALVLQNDLRCLSAGQNDLCSIRAIVAKLSFSSAERFVQYKSYGSALEFLSCKTICTV